jgi:hypothetical protein
VLLLLGGCSSDRHFAPLASGDCRIPPCTAPYSSVRGVAVDSGIADSGADAADGR